MRTLSIALVCFFTLGLTACNTVKGIGQDLQKAGEKIEDVSKKK